MKIKIPLLKLNENAVLPKFKHDTDAGADLIAVSCLYNEKYDRFEYGLGFATEIPEGYYIKIAPRSSNTKTEAYLPNGEGTIDSDYRGEWKVFYKLRTRFDELFPTGDRNLNLIEMENELAPYEVGDKIAQCFLCKKPDWEFVETDKLSETERGTDGGINRIDKDCKK